MTATASEGLFVVTDDTTRADLLEAIANLARIGKRQQHIVEKFSTDAPTPWTATHRRINVLLCEWQMRA